MTIKKNNINMFRLPLAIGASVTALAAAPAKADEAPLPVVAEAASDDGAIIVMARRREEEAQDVPVALSVVDATTLERTGNFTLGQVQQLVPSLQVFSFNPRNTNINIRGLGSNVALTNDGLENGVGFYVDNVYYGRPGQSQFDLIDLQQIEVLRGPQGTLFGKNTTAGAINITTRLPSFDPEFTGEATFGTYDYHQVRASLSAPLIADKAAFRISVADTHRDGFLTNLFDGSKAQDYDNFSIRGQFLLKPTENLSIRLIGDYSNQKQRFVLSVPVAYFSSYDSGLTFPNAFLQRVARAGYAPLPADPFARRGDSDSHYQAFMKGYGVSGEVNWDLGPASLTSVTAYRWWDWNPANDGDSTGLPVITKGQQANRQRQFSQEIRLASNDENSIDYVLGAYYFWQIIRGYGASAYGSAAPDWYAPTANPVIANAALNGFEANSTSTPETKSYALFGQANWNISDALSLTAGLRYTHEKKKGGFNQFWVAGADLSALSPTQAAGATAIRDRFNPVASYSAKLDDDSLSGLLTLSWKFVPDALVYATYSRGNKSGGLNLTNLPSGAIPQVKPETVDNYEIGFKSQLFDRKLTFNGAAYWTEVSDYQTAITQFNLTGANIQYISNIPKVRARGVEGDILFTPNELISFTAAAAYTDATYRDYTNAPQAPENNPALAPTQNLTGVQLGGVPKFTYALGGDVAQPLTEWEGRELLIYAHADYSHRSKFNTSSTNSRYAVVRGYGLLNARIGLRLDDGLWDLSLWARNLTNKNYYQTLNAQAIGFVTGLVGDPRTVGVTLRTKL
ncbi:TonB-dependent receptor [Rhizorhapis suberifaciens]|uniref:Iron complex outermembrane receptor protein n=1 Tax=Rhizorhapis suberifaciens TaxID=13656 RepID=A0A840HQ26_9SPHN|nr:TonB-dependent receptor [Rhizorhapis suberifaciens]MBB4639821.1 iron complex outermembrane receptor protein [Rhizorhapis suberifaciens]